MLKTKDTKRRCIQEKIVISFNIKKKESWYISFNHGPIKRISTHVDNVNT